MRFAAMENEMYQVEYAPPEPYLSSPECFYDEYWLISGKGLRDGLRINNEKDSETVCAALNLAASLKSKRLKSKLKTLTQDLTDIMEDLQS